MSYAVERALAHPTRVLIVEDDPLYVELIRELLTDSSPDFQISCAGSIEEACKRVDTGAIDIVLLDLGLPDCDGLDALKRLQHCITEIPVVVLTSRSDEELALAALKVGAEDYLVKTFIDQRTLVRTIRYARERHNFLRDISSVTRELQFANSALEKLTLLDPLTDLLNRRGLQQALSREIRRVERENTRALVLLVDVDDFKKVNDSFGHAVGDVALREIAGRLRKCVRSEDYVCRIGGDEFLLLLPDADPAEGVRIAERARVSIATRLIQHSAGVVRLTASVAALILKSDTPSIDELLTRAHQLLQRGKKEGKNRVVYQEGQFDDTGERLAAQSDLCTNLAHGKHLYTVKQPILRVADETPIAYEFLSRYSNGVSEMPDNFFRMCAERNVLTLVDHQCLRSAIRSAVSMNERVRFHINLFPSTLIAVPAEHLLATFPQPIPPDTFVLEISEQQIIGDPSYLLEPVESLRKAGVLIAIDDVGFGNSCLESLVLLEPDIIKIDKGCIIGLKRKDRARIDSLRRYVDLARTLGSSVVAEGVESGSELAILREMDVEFAQGFLWGKPE